MEKYEIALHVCFHSVKFHFKMFFLHFLKIIQWAHHIKLFDGLRFFILFYSTPDVRITSIISGKSRQ